MFVWARKETNQSLFLFDLGLCAWYVSTGDIMKEDRIALIRQMLFRGGKVSCSELTRMFDVTTATIRRDLDRLEAEGQIRRTHGGAELIRRQDQEAREIMVVPPWSSRIASCYEEKKAIAREVAVLIPDNSTVFIDSGTTIYEVAKLIAGRSNLTVISNSLRASEYLGMFPNIQLYFLGGKIAYSMLASAGIMARDCLSYFTVIDYCIISADAFSVENGMREHFMETAILKKAIIEKSNMVIAALDHTKFIKNASAPICNCSVDSIHTLVTDSGTDRENLEQLRRAGINVIVADTGRNK